MRIAIILCALLGLSVFSACRSVPPIVAIEGPEVAKFMVKTGTRWALAENHATAEKAIAIQSYIVQGRALIADGSAPAGALDQLAALLNDKIDSELVRRAIQQGIEFVKTNVTIPVDGLIQPELKVWILAVLDGAIAGCSEYAASLNAPGAVPSLAAPDVISFRR